ncbi:MAG: PIN/TRAM domain-containing protein [Planctomycetes bacterium]|nr:PIN/TRAM domain-containing protein [Planctomycetota bacterium]
MAIWIFRAIFMLGGGSAGYRVAKIADWNPFDGLVLGLVGALVLILVELAFTKAPISSISAIVFGLLIGIIFSIVFYHVILLIFGDEANLLLGYRLERNPNNPEARPIHVPRVTQDEFKQLLELALTVLFCYLGVAVLYQTRDSFNFIIPYVEFKKQEKGIRPVILDTSAIIDGRIADICDTKIIDGPVLVPRFVLQELQGIADSPDRLRRNRGRRGLDVLQRLQRTQGLEVKIHDPRGIASGAVDAKLISVAKSLDGRIVTNDFNLNKIAQLQGVDVINVNDLANALKPIALPGEEMSVRLMKEGEEPGQGVGYLEDGTMVVAEHGKEKIGQDVILIVTSVLQTSAGRMIFGKIKE